MLLGQVLSALWRVAPMPLGHQGGWDEALFVAVPLVIFFFLLRVAKRRAEAEADARTDAEEQAP